MTVTRASLARTLSQRLRLRQKDALMLVDNYFEVIVTVLEEGHCVNLTNFGQFSLHDKVARPGRNPKTKEAHVITARRVVQYKPSVNLKQKLKACRLG